MKRVRKSRSSRGNEALIFEKALGKCLGLHPTIISLSPAGLTDVWTDILKVAEALDVLESGKEVVRELKRRMVDVIEKACLLSKRPSVACLEWIDPLMAAGNWVPELVELAGGLNLFGDDGGNAPPESIFPPTQRLRLGNTLEGLY